MTTPLPSGQRRSTASPASSGRVATVRYDGSGRHSSQGSNLTVLGMALFPLTRLALRNALTSVWPPLLGLILRTLHGESKSARGRRSDRETQLHIALLVGPHPLLLYPQIVTIIPPVRFQLPTFAMGVRVEKATEADIPRLIAVRHDTFRDEPFHDATYPGGHSPEIRAKTVERTIKEMRSTPYLHVIKGVDVYSGAIMALAKCEFYEKERPESEWKKPLDVSFVEPQYREKALMFLEPMHAVRRKVWEGKPYIRELSPFSGTINLL